MLKAVLSCTEEALLLAISPHRRIQASCPTTAWREAAHIMHSMLPELTLAVTPPCATGGAQWTPEFPMTGAQIRLLTSLQPFSAEGQRCGRDITLICILAIRTSCGAVAPAEKECAPNAHRRLSTAKQCRASKKHHCCPWRHPGDSAPWTHSRPERPCQRLQRWRELKIDSRRDKSEGW